MREPDRRKTGLVGRRKSDGKAVDLLERHARARHDASFVARIALPLALIALIPSLIGIWLVTNDVSRVSRLETANHVLSAANHKQIGAISHIRRQSTENVRAASLNTCRVLNANVRAERKLIRNGPDAAVPILRAVGFTDVQINAYIVEARKAAMKQALELPLLAHGDCSKLPQPIPPPKVKRKATSVR